MSMMGLEPGAIVGRDFRVVQPLAAGAMGAVYVVDQLSTSKRRALKVMAMELASDPKHRERFVREAQVGSQIESDHVVEVVSAGIDEPTGAAYLVMELLKGEELAARLERVGAMPWGEVAEVMGQAGHALEAAHARGIVHRDLKPENIFVADSRREGVPFTVKILDFGIAKLIAERTQQGTQAIGTPLFMSPEQTDRNGQITPATDVWALGLIAFCMLAGTVYWRSEDITQLLREVVVDPIVPPSVRAAELGVPPSCLPPAFDEWFLHCVNRDPSARYPEAGSAVRALLALLPERSALSVVSGTAPTARTVVQAPAGSGPYAGATSAGYATSAKGAATTGAAAALGATVAAPADRTKSRAPLFVTLGVLAAGGAAAGIYFATAGSKASTGGEVASRPSASSVQPGPSNSAASSASSAAALGPDGCPAGMIFIEGGNMFMGSKDGGDNSRPAHKVALGDFCLDELEVTASSYDACVASGNCARASTNVALEGLSAEQNAFLSSLCTSEKAELASHPINCVDWTMADNFCKTTGGRLPKGGARLPTEAEWEYAARGSRQRIYPWGDEEPDEKRLNACGAECVAWERDHGLGSETMFAGDDGFPFTAPADSFPDGASSAGVKNLAGNVLEWVFDRFGPYTADEQSDPTGPAEGDERVVRGGAFNGADPEWTKPSFRWSTAPDSFNHAIGFRCAFAAR